MRLFISSLLVVAAASSLRADGERFSSGPARVSLVELYTSEGCSSCPPADRWLGGLQKADGLWKEYVPVAFHVSYWDHLGWTDRFASQTYTRRQYAYSAAWGANGVYTPCFIENGREWKPSGATPDAASGQAGTLTVTTSGNAYHLLFVPASRHPVRFDGHVALLGGGIRSRVTAGENDGSTLAHEFVVVSLADAGLSASADGTGFEATVKLAAPAPKDAPRLSVAAWVTPAGDLEPLQATGGWLRR